MPLEKPTREERAKRVEQTFESADCGSGRRDRIRTLFITATHDLVFLDRSRKERRRGQLVPVASHDNLLRAVEGWDRFFLEDLACLIENHHVEVAPATVEELADGQ